MSALKYTHKYVVKQQNKRENYYKPYAIFFKIHFEIILPSVPTSPT
jgi:hypothetical protein